MIKLIACYQPEYGYFRFYLESNCGITNSFFNLIAKECEENEAGREYFLPIRILGSLKDLGVECQIDVESKYEGRLREFLSNAKIIDDEGIPNHRVKINF